MENTIIKTPEILEVDSINGLSVKTKTDIHDAFLPFANQFLELEEKALSINVTEPSQTDLMSQARIARLALVKVRTGADAKRKELKAESIKYGNAVQDVYNKIEAKVSAIEAHLEKQEKFKELYDAKVLAERTAARMEKVQEFPDVTRAMIENLTDDMFETFLAGLIAKREKEIEDARIAEEQRIAALKAEEERKETERKEMERLKLENEAKEKEIAEQRKAAEAERLKQQAILDAERKKADELLETQRKQAEAEKKKQDEILAKQKAENDRLQAEIKRKEAEEALIKKQQQEKAAAEERARIAAEKKAAKAPDRDKLIKWLDECLLGFTPSVGADAHKVACEIQKKFEGFRVWAKEQIENI